MSCSIITLKLILATVGIIDSLKCLSTVRKWKGARWGSMVASHLLMCTRIFQHSRKFFKLKLWTDTYQTFRVESPFIQKWRTDYTLVQLSYHRRTMSYSCQAAVTSNHRSGRMGCRCQGGENLSSSSNQSTRAVRGFLEVQCRCHSRELSFYTPIFDHSASNYDGNIKLLWCCTLTSFTVRCLSNLNVITKHDHTIPDHIHESSIDAFRWIGYPWP